MRIFSTASHLHQMQSVWSWGCRSRLHDLHTKLYVVPNEVANRCDDRVHTCESLYTCVNVNGNGNDLLCETCVDFVQRRSDSVWDDVVICYGLL